MRASHRILLGFVTARLVFGAAFLSAYVARWPVLWYRPLARQWAYGSSVTGLAMDWYGRSLLALALGAAVGAGAWALAGVPRLGRVLVRRGVITGVAHLGALLLLNDVVFYVLVLLTGQVHPEPLPSWYCPR